MTVNKRKSFIFASSLHRDIMLMVFVASLIPALITGICLYYLIFSITAYQIGFPDLMMTILIPALKQVNVIILIALPLSLVLIWFWALAFTHRIVGPLDRLSKDMDGIIAGVKKDHIRIRARDSIEGIVKKINRLIDKIRH